MMLFTLMLSTLISVSDADAKASAQTLLEQAQWEDAAMELDAIVQDEKSPSPELLYDRGIAHYNLGNYEVAAKAFEDAMSVGTEATFKSNASYNFGNAMYQNAMKSLEGMGTSEVTEEAIESIDAAKSQINNSLSQYREAIKNDSTDDDARANGELAWKMLNMLNQMKEQMEEQQQQQEQEDAQQQEQEQEEQDQSGEETPQENQEGSDSKKQQEQNQEQSEEQEEGGESQDSMDAKDNQESKDEKDAQESQESLDDKDTQDSEIEGELESIQEELDELLKNAQEEMGEASKAKEGNRLSKEDAARLLQLIRDKEKSRRAMLAARRAANRVPVLRDW